MINQDDERKIGNTLAHIVDSGLEKGRTKLVKVPVFADLVSYNLFGEFVTCDTYIKQDHGPMGDIAGELTRKSNKYLIFVSDNSTHVTKAAHIICDCTKINKIQELKNYCTQH